MAEHAVDVHERDLTVLVHRGDVRLHHHRALLAKQGFDVSTSEIGVVRHCVARGVLRAGRDDRFDHEIPAIGESYGIARLDPGRGYHGYAGALHVAQIPLVEIPLEHVGRIDERRTQRNSSQPPHELVVTRGVVPGRSHHHEIERSPIDTAIVPVDHARLDATPDERIEQRCLVVVGATRHHCGDERDTAHDVSSSPSSPASSIGRSPWMLWPAPATVCTITDG